MGTVAEPMLTNAPVAALTVFRCASWRSLARIVWEHRRVKRDVRRRVDGFVAVSLGVDVRTRTAFSLSLWRDLAAMRNVGHARRHVEAARQTLRSADVETEQMVYQPLGDWRTVLWDESDMWSIPVAERAGTSSDRKETDHHA